jgi:hypothetical protein
MKLQQLAQSLGYAGLIPFIVFSLATWVSLPLVNNPHLILTTYAAIILSFMGAIHWGVAMTRASTAAHLELGLSVLPALLGWLALLISTLLAYGLLIMGFAVLYWADSYTNQRGFLPEWYLPMRRILTAVVLVCLCIAALALTAA